MVVNAIPLPLYLAAVLSWKMVLVSLGWSLLRTEMHRELGMGPEWRRGCRKQRLLGPKWHVKMRALKCHVKKDHWEYQRPQSSDATDVLTVVGRMHAELHLWKSMHHTRTYAATLCLGA